MSAKLLVNGEAGSGKTSLLKDLKDAFVVSRDGKNFPFSIPHMLVRSYTDMNTLINGGVLKDEEGNEITIEGIVDKIEKYKEKLGSYPKIVVFDSVSKLYLDVIEYATQNVPKEWGQQGAFVNKEIGILNNFIQDDLIANDISVILMNHVISDENDTFVSAVGMGKFANKGGFYSEVDNSILIHNMKVYHRGVKYHARTLLPDLPDTQPVANIIHPTKSKKLKEGEEYYNLQKHMEMIVDLHANNDEWKF
jgi:hypothetical protein